MFPFHYHVLNRYCLRCCLAYGSNLKNTSCSIVMGLGGGASLAVPYHDIRMKQQNSS